MKDLIGMIVFCYFLLSFLFLAIRGATEDCRYRYVDYVFPASLLFCEVRK